MQNSIFTIDVLSAKGLNRTLIDFQINVLFRKQIHRSVAVSYDDDDPVFNFSCSFNVGDIPDTEDTAVLIYLTVDSPKVDALDQSTSKSIIATATVDFRYSQLFAADFISVELLPSSDDDGIGELLGPAGLLFVRMEIKDRVSKMTLYCNLSETRLSEIENAISATQENLLINQKRFIIFLREWFTQIQKKHPHMQDRKLQILARDECGHHRFVGSFLAPVKSSRLLLNARFAARFVSLIPFKRNLSLTGSTAEVWHSAHAFLSRMEGDVEDHALLLCSLLLGWGLDAWVATGNIYTVQSNSSRPTSGQQAASVTKAHCWVVTFDRIEDHHEPTHASSSLPTAARTKVTFWESLTGTQYDVQSAGSVSKHDTLGLPVSGAKAALQSHHFSDLFCLFRHDRYLAICCVCFI